jgi:hypothetical protein
VQSRGWNQPVVGCLGPAGEPLPGADYSNPLYQVMSRSGRENPEISELAAVHLSSSGSLGVVRRKERSSTGSSTSSSGSGGCHSRVQPPLSQGVAVHIMRRGSGNVSGNGRTTSVDSIASSTASFYSCYEEYSSGTTSITGTVDPRIETHSTSNYDASDLSDLRSVHPVRGYMHHGDGYGIMQRQLSNESVLIGSEVDSVNGYGTPPLPPGSPKSNSSSPVMRSEVRKHAKWEAGGGIVGTNVPLLSGGDDVLSDDCDSVDSDSSTELNRRNWCCRFLSCCV